LDLGTLADPSDRPPTGPPVESGADRRAADDHSAYVTGPPCTRRRALGAVVLLAVGSLLVAGVRARRSARSSASPLRR